jgi:hypothetical protein
MNNINEQFDNLLIEDIPVDKNKWIVKNFYMKNNKIYRWNGKDLILCCEHKKRKLYCRDCKGSQFCMHDKIKDRCVECKGSSICPHNKVKSACKECKGSRFCQHNRTKSQCTECKGGSICLHNKRKHRCLECKGASICEHQKIRSRCIKCKGSEMCEHNKRKACCKTCKGNDYCKHERIKSTCKECKGSRICKHNIEKRKCYRCATNRTPFCKQCNFYIVCKQAKTHPYCRDCFHQLYPDANIPNKFKRKQNYLHELLKQDFTITSYDKTVNACSKRRPDIFFEFITHTIIVEIDEDAHKSYDSVCEETRTNEIFTDLADRPMVMIRFNPDKTKTRIGCFEFDKDNILIPNKEELDHRYQLLKSTIEHYTDYNNIEELSTIEYLFFD